MVEQGKILINEKVGKDIWRMEIKSPWIAKKAAAVSSCSAEAVSC